MFNQLLAVAIKDTKLLVRNTGAMITLFVMPIIFILVMTSAGSGTVGASDTPVRVLAVNQDAGPQGAQGLVVEQRPNAAQQNVPAYTIFGIFWIVQALALSILRERRAGTFRRLQAAPLSRAVLLGGKLLPQWGVTLAQVMVMFGIGMLAFGLTIPGSALALLLVTLAVTAAAAGLGLLVASISTSEEQAGGLSSILLITLAALGGMFIPLAAMPAMMQQVGLLTPHAWALSGFQDVLVRGLGVRAVLGEAGVLLAFASVFFAAALRRAPHP